MAGVLRLPARVRPLADGWARLRTRAAFAVVLIWLIVTIVAIAAIAPAWAWWSAALGHAIEGARLLGSPNVGTFAEVLREAPFGLRTIATAALAAAILALLLNPFLAGGLIGALGRDPVAGDADGRVVRFAADGVRFYGALLRVALIVWPIAAVAVATATIAAALPFIGTERPALSLAASGLAAGACTLAAAMLVDVARIHVVAHGTRRAGAAVAAALGLVLRQPLALLRIAVAFGLAFVAAGAAVMALRGWLSGDTWPAILAGIAAQQAHAFTRTWLRAAMVASEQVLVEADRDARALAGSAASVAAGEERPEVLVVVQGEAGEGGPSCEEGRRRDELPPQVAGGLSAEGDGRRGDADTGEAGPALPVLAGDRRRDEPPPVS